MDVMLASSGFKSIEEYAMFPSLRLQVLLPWSLEGVMVLCVDSVLCVSHVSLHCVDVDLQVG